MISLKRLFLRLGTDFALERWLVERLEIKNTRCKLTTANFLNEQINFHSGSDVLPRWLQGDCKRLLRFPVWFRRDQWCGRQ
jgi:hypothetical protein